MIPLIPQFNFNIARYSDDELLVNDIQRALLSLNMTIARAFNGMVLQGLTASMPAAGQSGRFYFATDTSIMYYDNGSSWVSI
jgi:hypothetical protein